MNINPQSFEPIFPLDIEVKKKEIFGGLNIKT